MGSRVARPQNPGQAPRPAALSVAGRKPHAMCFHLDLRSACATRGLLQLGFSRPQGALVPRGAELRGPGLGIPR